MVAKKKASGPSGAHTTARRKVTLTPEDKAAQDAAAARAGLTWADWARVHLERAARVSQFWANASGDS